MDINERIAQTIQLDLDKPLKDALIRLSSRMLQRTHSQITPEIDGCVATYVKELTATLRGVGNDWLAANDELEVVPSGTKLLRKYGGGALVLVEESPAVRTVAFNSKQGQGYFGLAFPYVVFAIYLFKDSNAPVVRVAFANKPITSLQSKVYTPNLPNHLSTLCMDVQVEWDDTLAENVNHIIEKFWNTSFNNDMADNFNEFASQDIRFSDLATWEGHSRENPLFVLSVDWPQETTLEKFLQIDRNLGGTETRIMTKGDVVGKLVSKSAENIRGFLEEAEQWMMKDKDTQYAISDFRIGLEAQIHRVLGECQVQHREDLKKMEKLKEEIDRLTVQLNRVEINAKLATPDNKEVW
jgi:hypothetical protein